MNSALQAVDLDPNRAEDHLNAGVARERLGQTHAAERAFRRAVHLKPSLTGARSNLGGALPALGWLDEGG